MDLRSEVICTPRASPAARNRFLHVPLTKGLQPLPSSLLSLFTLPLGRLVLKSVLAEPFTPANRPGSQHTPPLSPPSSPSGAPTIPDTAGTVDEDTEDEDEDESVDSFFSRRFGEAFARTLGSALIHGIYAADSRQLSLLAAFPQLRTSETRGNGSVIWGELGPPAWFGRSQFGGGEEDEWEGDREWETRFGRAAALFSFREGMETLVRALVEALQGFPNVVLWSNTAVRKIGIDTVDDGDGDSDGGDHCSFKVRQFAVFCRFFFGRLYVGLRLRKKTQIHVDAKDDEGEDANKDVVILKATHVISALPLPVLDSIFQPSVPAGAAGAASAHKSSLPHLRANPHSSVTVLNLVFPNDPPNNSTGESTTTPLHPPGFGYLIPRPEHGYDGGSLISEPQPTRVEEEPGPQVGLLGVVFDTASLPEQDHDGENDAGAAKFTKLTAMLGGPYPPAHELSDAQLVEAVLQHISSHFGHALPQPVHYAVHRNAESIPTYLVGHTARMGKLKHTLHERCGGRMKVIGAGVSGVSVADCVKAGRQAASEVGAQIGN